MGVFPQFFVPRRREMTNTFALVVFDVFALYEASIISYSIRAHADKPFVQYVSARGFGELSAAIAPLWVAIFALCGLYSVRQDRGRVSEFGRVVVAVSGGVMFLIVLDYMQQRAPLFPGRAVPVYALGLGIVFVLACRQLVRLGMHAIFVSGRGLHNVILIGTGDLARRMLVSLSKPSQGCRVVAAVDAERDGMTLPGDIPVYPTLDRALATNKARIDEVVQADTQLDRDEVARLMSLANSRGISYRFVPDQYGVYAAASTMTIVDGVPVMEVRLTSLDGWGAVGKRVFDAVGSMLLLVVLSPLLLGLALAVKITDPSGPILYRQRRLGRGGREIGVLKFRSMRWRHCTGPGRQYANAIEVFEAIGRVELCEEFRLHHKVADDPRTTPVGRFMRRTSLDELPQLVNALRGELSLVGPRAITREELQRYGSQRASLLALKPGITGLWQVSGRSNTGYDERVKLDVHYVENWSISLDLRILAKTVVAVAGRDGAY